MGCLQLGLHARATGRHYGENSLRTPSLICQKGRDIPVRRLWSFPRLLTDRPEREVEVETIRGVGCCARSSRQVPLLHPLARTGSRGFCDVLCVSDPQWSPRGLCWSLRSTHPRDSCKATRMPQDE